VSHASATPARRLRPLLRTVRATLLAATAFAAVAAASPSMAASSPQGRSVRAKKDKNPGKGHKGKGNPAAKHTKGAAAARPAEPPITTALAPIEMNLSIQRASLENGLRVVMNVERTVPAVAVAMVYGAGSGAERKHQAGLSGLVEQYMFQGSPNLAPGEHVRLVASRGGVVSTSASPDRTSYVQSLPAGELALALWLEADRMKSLRFAPDAFENHRKAAREKYQALLAGAPYTLSRMRLKELVFQGYWPYEHDGLIAATDLDKATIEAVRDFYERNYTPGNAVLSIAGDFDPDAAMALVHRYFDKISRARSQPPEPGALPEQTSQRTAVLRDPGARTPDVFYGFSIPPARHPDHHALELAARILGDGDSSRLHEALVRKEAIAESVSAETDGRLGPDLFSIQAKLTSTARMGDVEKVIEGEIRSLGTQGPSETETEKARRRQRAAFFSGLETNAARATRLGEMELSGNDPRLLPAELSRYLAVTAADIKRVCASYLGPTRRTIVETYPPEAAGAAKESNPRPHVRPVASPQPSKPAPAAPKASGKPPVRKAPSKKPKK
jgi:zinc protease